jgi:hypothetical protein
VFTEYGALMASTILKSLSFADATIYPVALKSEAKLWAAEAAFQGEAIGAVFL